MKYILKNQLYKKYIQQKKTNIKFNKLSLGEGILKIEKPLMYMKKVDQMIKLSIQNVNQREYYWTELLLDKPSKIYTIIQMSMKFWNMVKKLINLM